MKTYILILFLFFPTYNILVGQTISNCNIPIHLTVDSLNNFLMTDYLKRIYRTTIPLGSIEFRKKFDYEKSKTKNFDSIYWCCENYLIKKLGKDVYCNFVDMQRQCCRIETKPKNGFVISFGLQLPNLISKVRYGWVDYNNERVTIDFIIVTNADSTLNIIYPKNVPDCKGFPDCEFIITKAKALEILKKSGTLPDNVEYTISVDGINWVIMFEYKYVINKVRINLQTGEQTKIEQYLRQ